MNKATWTPYDRHPAVSLSVMVVAGPDPDGAFCIRTEEGKLAVVDAPQLAIEGPLRDDAVWCACGDSIEPGSEGRCWNCVANLQDRIEQLSAFLRRAQGERGELARKLEAHEKQASLFAEGRIAILETELATAQNQKATAEARYDVAVALLTRMQAIAGSAIEGRRIEPPPLHIDDDSGKGEP